MAETKWPAGPWKWTCILGESYLASAASDFTLHFDSIWVDGDHTKRIAIADLIVASPELYDALVATVRLLEKRTKPEDQLASVILVEATAALAKARGETK